MKLNFVMSIFKNSKNYLRAFLTQFLNFLPFSSNIVGAPRRIITSKEASLISISKVEYQKILDEEVVTEKPPFTIDDTIFFKYSTLYNRKVPEQFILTIKNGRVWGKGGAIITDNDMLISDVSKEFGPAKLNLSEHPIFKQLKLKKAVHYNCTIAVIVSPGTHVYGHWFGDILPRLLLLKKSGKLDKANKILISGELNSFQEETLNLLEIDTNKIISIKAINQQISANTLLVPSYPNDHGTVNKWVIQIIREAFYINLPIRSATIANRIFISRSKAVGRQLENEEEVFEYLNKEYGFIKIYAEDYSLVEKIKLFGSADSVVAPHGSGLTNILFCNKGTKIVDIFPPGDFDTFFWSMANSCELNFYYFFGEGELPTKENDFTSRNTDTLVSMEKFKALMNLVNLNKL